MEYPLIPNGTKVKIHSNKHGHEFMGEVQSYKIDHVDGQQDLTIYSVKIGNGEILEANHYHVREIMHPSNVKVEQAATICLWTDRYACTVIAVSKSGKKITLQRDHAKQLTAPAIVPGGFCGHCTNNDEIEYEYARNEQGEIYTANWSEVKGKFVSKTGNVIPGKSEKYDYNF